MKSIAHSVLEWIEANPTVSGEKKNLALKEIPPSQWALHGGHWSELSIHCGNRVEAPQEVRFMNRLSINIMTPLARCLYRSPDGRGLAWLKSGGEVIAYGICEQSQCERAKCAQG